MKLFEKARKRRIKRCRAGDPARVRGCWAGNHCVMTFSHLEKQTLSVAGAEFYLSQVNKSLQLFRNCHSTRYKNTVRL